MKVHQAPSGAECWIVNQVLGINISLLPELVVYWLQLL